MGPTNRISHEELTYNQSCDSTQNGHKHELRAKKATKRQNKQSNERNKMSKLK